MTACPVPASAPSCARHASPTRWRRLSALFAGLLAPGLAAAECATGEEAVFACAASTGERVALCAAAGTLRTDAFDAITIDPAGALRFRARIGGHAFVVPDRPTATLEAFDADTGSAKGAGAWWSDLGATDGPRTIAVSVGVSDLREAQITFSIEDRERGILGNFQCDDLAIDATPTRRGVDARYYRVVSALTK